MEKVQRGNYVELKELLPYNVALLQRLQEVGGQPQVPASSQSRLRDIRDPLTWVACFLSFVAAKVNHAETRELMAYGQIVLQLARRHGGLGWIAYDSQFRQQAAAGSVASWSELNPSLMAATVLNAGGDAGGRGCTLVWRRITADKIVPSCRWRYM